MRASSCVMCECVRCVWRSVEQAGTATVAKRLIGQYNLCFAIVLMAIYAVQRTCGVRNQQTTALRHFAL